MFWRDFFFILQNEAKIDSIIFSWLDSQGHFILIHLLFWGRLISPTLFKYWQKIFSHKLENFKIQQMWTSGILKLKFLQVLKAN